MLLLPLPIAPLPATITAARAETGSASSSSSPSASSSQRESSSGVSASSRLSSAGSSAPPPPPYTASTARRPCAEHAPRHRSSASASCAAAAAAAAAAARPCPGLASADPWWPPPCICASREAGGVGGTGAWQGPGLCAMRMPRRFATAAVRVARAMPSCRRRIASCCMATRRWRMESSTCLGGTGGAGAACGVVGAAWASACPPPAEVDWAACRMREAAAAAAAVPAPGGEPNVPAPLPPLPAGLATPPANGWCAPCCCCCCCCCCWWCAMPPSSRSISSSSSSLRPLLLLLPWPPSLPPLSSTGAYSGDRSARACSRASCATSFGVAHSEGGPALRDMDHTAASVPAAAVVPCCHRSTLSKSTGVEPSAAAGPACCGGCCFASSSPSSCSHARDCTTPTVAFAASRSSRSSSGPPLTPSAAASPARAAAASATGRRSPAPSPAASTGCRVTSASATLSMRPTHFAVAERSASSVASCARGSSRCCACSARGGNTRRKP